MEKKKSKRVCYLRTCRRAYGLTAPALASLMGLKSLSHISRVENGKRPPTIGVALACQVIFGVPPSEMFPHAFTVVEDRVMWNIQQHHSALQKSTSLSGLRKRELCEKAMKRAIERRPPEPPKI